MINQSIYFDNAATTPINKEVLESMLPFLSDNFGNPSSSYSYGRTTRIAIEMARKTVARLLSVKPSTIFFTSGGTESNNTAIAASLRDLGCNYIITSPIEHHAVLHTVEYYSRSNQVPVSYVALTTDGHVKYADLERQLKEQTIVGHKCLVSLMHANNEIGCLLEINEVARLCKKYNAIFHSDCVQTVGHYSLDLAEIGVHLISAASHKFHGPKGVGILYVSDEIQIQPLIHGGGQERNHRAGTENVYGIVGFSKALEVAMRDFENDSKYIRNLNAYMRIQLSEAIPGISFNTPCNSLYTLLSVCFPKSYESESLLLNLDMAGICVSGGSACSSGENIGSHVMKALQKINDCTTIRFSFSKYNTVDEIDKVVDTIQTILHLQTVH